jgi:hypothetical protein
MLNLELSLFLRSREIMMTGIIETIVYKDPGSLDSMSPKRADISLKYCEFLETNKTMICGKQPKKSINKFITAFLYDLNFKIKVTIR